MASMSKTLKAGPDLYDRDQISSLQRMHDTARLYVAQFSVFPAGVRE